MVVRVPSALAAATSASMPLGAAVAAAVVGAAVGTAVAAGAAGAQAARISVPINTTAIPLNVRHGDRVTCFGILSSFRRTTVCNNTSQVIWTGNFEGYLAVRPTSHRVYGIVSDAGAASRFSPQFSTTRRRVKPQAM